jgi:hypothetical protein
MREFIEKTRNYDDSRAISLQRNDLGVVVWLVERRYRWLVMSFQSRMKRQNLLLHSMQR